ncbi:MAG: hypothetical protein R6V86_12250 [Spirochaetia bacterium]
MIRYLEHEKVVVRFFSLYLLGLALFFVSWTLSYLFLPEGLIRGQLPFTKITGDAAAESLLKEFFTIFGINLMGFLVIIIGNYILRVRTIAFGYLIPLAWMMIYGLILGTNSFSIPLEEPSAPTLAVFGRSGLYEMAAAVLLAVATNSISINRSTTFRTPSKPVPKQERSSLQTEQWVAVAISVLILAGAAFREAYMIMQA